MSDFAARTIAAVNGKDQGVAFEDIVDVIGGHYYLAVGLYTGDVGDKATLLNFEEKN